MAKNSTRELPPEPPFNPTLSSGTDLQEEIDRHDHAVDNIDRTAIDQIVLSNDMNKGGKIRIERKGPTDSSYAWISTIPVEDWVKTGSDGMMEYFKNNFGGGEYRCMSHRADGRTYKGFTFSIDRRFKGALDEDQIRAMQDNKRGSSVIIPPAPQDGFKPADMLKLMEMSNNKSDQMMALVMTMMSKSQESTVAMMTAMFTAMGNRQQATAPSGLDPVIAEILKQKVDRSPMTEVLETMRALKELQEPVNPEPKEDDMLSKIMKMAGTVLPALTGLQPPPQLVNGQPPQSSGVVNALPMAIQLGIGQLLKAARKGADPVLYADLIIDQLDDPQHFATLKAILTDPTWKAKLFGDERTVADISPWLEELRKLILSYDPSAEDNQQSASGDEVSAAGASGSVGGPATDTSIS